MVKASRELEFPTQDRVVFLEVCPGSKRTGPAKRRERRGCAKAAFKRWEYGLCGLVMHRVTVDSPLSILSIGRSPGIGGAFHGTVGLWSRSEDSMADGAVCCEPVSPGQTLVMAGKNREFHDFHKRFGTPLSAESARDQTAPENSLEFKTGKFPDRSENSNSLIQIRIREKACRTAGNAPPTN
jgi:hypothetical protein